MSKKDGELYNRQLKPFTTQNWVKVNDEESPNSKFINHELAIMKYATTHCVDFTDYDQVADACTFYMGECALADVKPNVVGLCATLRIRKEAFYNFINGKGLINPAARDLLEQMFSLMEYTLNLSITDSKQNPVGSMFLLKNQHHYTDKTEFVVGQNNNEIAELSDNEIKEKYMGNVIIPDDDE